MINYIKNLSNYKSEIIMISKIGLIVGLSFSLILLINYSIADNIGDFEYEFIDVYCNNDFDIVIYLFNDTFDGKKFKSYNCHILVKKIKQTENEQCKIEYKFHYGNSSFDNPEFGVIEIDIFHSSDLQLNNEELFHWRLPLEFPKGLHRGNLFVNCSGIEKARSQTKLSFNMDDDIKRDYEAEHIAAIREQSESIKVTGIAALAAAIATIMITAVTLFELKKNK